LDFVLYKRLYKEICNIISYGNVLENDISWFNLFLDKVVFYIDMLCLSMVFIIQTIDNQSLVISMNGNRFDKWQSNFTEILAYPKYLGCSLKEHHILGLHSWKHQSPVSCFLMILVLLPPRKCSLQLSVTSSYI